MFKLLLVKGLLAFGLSLCAEKHYEEAIPILTIASDLATNEDLVLINYNLAIANYQVMRQEKTIYYCNAVLDSFIPVPRRYEVMCSLIKEDTVRWRQDLTDISRKMNDVSNRLEGSKGGPITQDKQKKILEDLDKKIKQIEDAAKSKSDIDAKFESDDSSGKNVNKPKNKSELPPEDVNEGKILDRELKNIAKVWGTLPDSERIKIAQRMTLEAPPRYKAYIEAYFKALNEK